MPFCLWPGNEARVFHAIGNPYTPEFNINCTICILADLLGIVRIPILDKNTNAVHPGHEMEASFPLKPPGSGKIDFKIYTDITNGKFLYR